MLLFHITIPAKLVPACFKRGAGIHNLLNLQELDSSPNVSIGDKNPWLKHSGAGLGNDRKRVFQQPAKEKYDRCGEIVMVKDQGQTAKRISILQAEDYRQLLRVS